MPQSILDLCFPNLNIQSLVLMQLFNLHGSSITVSLCNSTKISRKEATGCPFTKCEVILRAQDNTKSREGSPFQTQKHREGIGQRAKMCSSSSIRQNGQETCRHRGSAVLAAFLSKPFIPTINLCPSACHLLFYLSSTLLAVQCPFSCCFSVLVCSLTPKLTFPCQSS